MRAWGGEGGVYLISLVVFVFVLMECLVGFAQSS